MGCFNGFLCYDGVEFVNAARDFHYMNTMGHPGIVGPIDTSCICDGLGTGDANTGPWTNPVDDDAWWYDPLVPASADVVGLWIEDFKISAPMKREVKERLWGASIGSPVYGKREVVITGWVLTKSASATSYMRQAIHELLVGDDNCGGCSPPDMTYWETCPTDGDRHVRKILQCGLTQLDWEVEPTFDYAQGSKFIATLTSEIPWIAKEPATMYEAPALDSVPICNICNPCPSSSTVDLSCGCLTESVQVVPEPDRFGCYHAPITVARSCILISPTILWGQGVINLEIYAGLAHNADGSGLRNMRVRGWPNPDGLGVDSASIVCTEPCIDIEIACLPAGSTLTIDSMKRRAKIVKDGRESRGVRYLSSSDGGIFRWPEFSCAGLYLCIDADGTGTSDTATVRIETQEFERA